jgi:hypothetical protein
VLNRFRLSVVLIAGFAALLAGCGSNTDVGTIQITPAAQSLAAGQTAQFSATGIIPHGKHPASTQDVTNSVTWASNAPAIATISATGVATAVSAGTATITASMAGATSATAIITVTGGGTVTNSDVVQLSLIPGSQSVASPTQTTQFLAIGSTAAGATVDLTSRATWSSSSKSVATVTSTGLATGVGKGTTTISAIFTNSDQTVATGDSTLTVINGTAEPIADITLSPSTVSLSAGGHQTAQLIAMATDGNTGLKLDVTTSPHIKWNSSVDQVATVSASGQVTGISPGSAIITAQWTNPDNTVVSASATVTVSSVYVTSSLLSLSIVPGIITVGDLQDTGNFLAIGTFSTPPIVRDLTNSVTWISAFPDVFPVSTNSGGTTSASGGIVTAYGTGSTTIIAEATGSDGSIQTATATFSCPLVLPDPTTHPPTPGSCWTGQVGPLKATLTVYGEGLNTTNWLVTGPSATGTPDVIHCGPGWAAGGGSGGSVCTGIYPIGTTVTLTAPARTGVAFGGWTYNCTPTATITAPGPNSCTIVLGQTNATVGAIFNNQ